MSDAPVRRGREKPLLLPGKADIRASMVQQQVSFTRRRWAPINSALLHFFFIFKLGAVAHVEYTDHGPLRYHRRAPKKDVVSSIAPMAQRGDTFLLLYSDVRLEEGVGARVRGRRQFLTRERKYNVIYYTANRQASIVHTQLMWLK